MSLKVEEGGRSGRSGKMEYDKTWPNVIGFEGGGGGPKPRNVSGL